MLRILGLGGNEARVAMERILQGASYERIFKNGSPPDPSINFNTARKAYHDGTAAWFTRGVTFDSWKALSFDNLLWIYGKGIVLLFRAP